MSPVALVQLEIELGRSMRAKQDGLAQRLIAKIKRERASRPEPVQTPDLERLQEFCGCGRALEPWELAECEACRRGRR